MIKVKNSQILNAVQVLNELLGTKMNIVLSYKMLIIRDLVQEKISQYQQEERNIQQKYIKRKEDGSPLFVKNPDGTEDTNRIQLENIDQMKKEIEEIQNKQVDLQLETIGLSEMKDLSIEPSKLHLIAWLIDISR